MQHSKKWAKILNDLVVINDDRIKEYNKAINSLEQSDEELKNLFTQKAFKSRNHITTLQAMIKTFGGKIGSGASTRGKVFRTWMDVKSLFTVNENSLDYCEVGVNDVVYAYRTALSIDGEMTSDLCNKLLSQMSSFKQDQSEIKALRQLQK
ncbi:PA2169 family four-helix-bundle protein [Mongoliibacter ruber]|uniref:Uncharacterized protein (TIGR02284 family) n=1 Tax=Mongoliibacter ruber TaxID=1750599 RepID=A0A2T0WD43_9BACT|nr:PA2169 family four-helix-bundle protein [Mongoliibacter ruber]PRY84627.1 uncharacterized protein (TIGR02284 family) [Mongoliibacter ruber]